MTALSAGDRAAIEASLRRAASYSVAPLSAGQLEAAISLATDLYATAARHGLTRADADGVTSFVAATLDGVRARGWRRPSSACDGTVAT